MKRLLTAIALCLMCATSFAQTDTVSEYHFDVVLDSYNGDFQLAEPGYLCRDFEVCLEWHHQHWGNEPDSTHHLGLVVNDSTYWGFLTVDTNYDHIHIYPADIIELTGESEYYNIALTTDIQDDYQIIISQIYTHMVKDYNPAVQDHDNTVEVYPNPVDNQLTVVGQYKKLMVFNMRGQLVYYDENSTSNMTILNTSRLTPGLYVLSLDGRETKFVKK